MEKDIKIKAFRIAAEAHRGQKRKHSGDDYITHPIRVTEIAIAALRKYYETFEYFEPDDVIIDQYYTVAMLHDVVEDCDVTLEDIEREFGERIREAIDALTKRDGESYLDFILRAKKDDIALVVKRADIEHNMSDIKEGSLKEKYLLAMHILNNR